MPGKPDYGSPGTSGIGQYAPGSKEYRAWNEGWMRRYIVGSASKPNTVHTAGTSEFIADQAGWDQANNNSTGSRRMPAIFGVPPV